MSGQEEKKRIYMDYAASTPVSQSVREAMAPYARERYGNPGGLHREAVEAREAVGEARRRVAAALRARPSQIVFTSGATEANNMAIFGVVARREREGVRLADMHLITSAIEHPSVSMPMQEFARRGARVSHIRVSPEGVVDVQALEATLTKETLLVSIIHASNEIGTIQPIREIARLIRRHNEATGARTLLHTDAVQSPLYLDVSPDTLHADMITLGGQKMYGPKGVGALFVRDPDLIAPLFYGGKQEGGLRPGTENVPLIVGFAQALADAAFNRDATAAHAQHLRDMLIVGITRALPHTLLNGHATDRLPNNVNMTFPGHDGEMLALRLDAAGISVSTRSACLSEEGTVSPVIAALGAPVRDNAIRFSLGSGTTAEEVEYVIKTLATIART